MVMIHTGFMNPTRWTEPGPADGGRIPGSLSHN